MPAFAACTPAACREKTGTHKQKRLVAKRQISNSLAGGSALPLADSAFRQKAVSTVDRYWEKVSMVGLRRGLCRQLQQAVPKPGLRAEAGNPLCGRAAAGIAVCRAPASGA